ncbi:MAG TPA: cytochrome c-type biogenesis protein [Gemmatimonadaceae bacterium]|nr:cytochrome c-type biogenesis protein [Gemmatimonadaceae bacterium]
MRAAFALLVVAVLALAVTPFASAAQSTPSDTVLEARVRAVASELRCPVCQGESIQDSPSALAQEMRTIVREQLAAGKSPDDVKRYFTDKYGEWILLRPRAVGWNVLVYVLPVIALLVGAAVVMRATRRWAAQPQGAPAVPGDPEKAQTG